MTKKEKKAEAERAYKKIQETAWTEYLVECMRSERMPEEEIIEVDGNRYQLISNMKHTNITDEITGEYYKRPFWDFSWENDWVTVVGVVAMIAVTFIIYVVIMVIS